MFRRGGTWWPNALLETVKVEVEGCGRLMAVLKHQYQRRTLVMFTVEIATLFFTPTILMKRKKIATCVVGSAKIASRADNGIEEMYRTSGTGQQEPIRLSEQIKRCTKKIGVCGMLQSQRQIVLSRE
ncbi:hypothetical protein L1987_24816 [Smallanthus sonchifolius]|uniref:Uncharacterized protein n=1 Tax=Smallanthus sonchifolius TaxID=185202 RepID=A0ACB9IKU4_9ASTR|nr:hypothetical protein L1987_24816 [Smallanthus sonchifolius]